MSFKFSNELVQLRTENPDALMPCGLDNAFIGLGYHNGGIGPVATYDKHKCINLLMKSMDATQEEALEYFEYNVLHAYVGINSPIFVQSEDGII